MERHNTSFRFCRAHPESASIALHGVNCSQFSEFQAWLGNCSESQIDPQVNNPDKWQVYRGIVHEANHLRAFESTPLGWALQHFRAIQLQYAIQKLNSTEDAERMLPLFEPINALRQWHAPHAFLERLCYKAESFRRRLRPATLWSDLAVTAETNHNLLYGRRIWATKRTHEQKPIRAERRLLRLCPPGRPNAGVRILTNAVRDTFRNKRGRPFGTILDRGLRWFGVGSLPEHLGRYFDAENHCPVIKMSDGDWTVSGEDILEVRAVLSEYLVAWANNALSLPRSDRPGAVALMKRFRELFPRVRPLETALRAGNPGGGMEVELFQQYGWLLAAIEIALWTPWHPTGSIPGAEKFTWFDIHPGWRCILVLECASRFAQEHDFSDRNKTSGRIASIANALGWPCYTELCMLWFPVAHDNDLISLSAGRSFWGQAGSVDAIWTRRLAEIGVMGFQGQFGFGTGVETFGSVASMIFEDKAVGVKERFGHPAKLHGESYLIKRLVHGQAQPPRVLVDWLNDFGEKFLESIPPAKRDIARPWVMYP